MLTTTSRMEFHITQVGTLIAGILISMDITLDIDVTHPVYLWFNDSINRLIIAVRGDRIALYTNGTLLPEQKKTFRSGRSFFHLI